MTIILNYTPHTVNVLRPDGSLYGPIDSSGVARAVEHVEPLKPISWDVFGDCGYHQTVPTVTRSFGAVTGLHDPQPDTLYIVSQIVFDTLPDRTDLLVPSDVVRGPDGQVRGCRAFSRRAAVESVDPIRARQIKELTRLTAQAIEGSRITGVWPARVPLDTVGELEVAPTVVSGYHGQGLNVEIVDSPSPDHPGSRATRHIAVTLR